MLRFTIRRLLGGIGVLWGVITLVFIIGYVIPINPAQ